MALECHKCYADKNLGEEEQEKKWAKTRQLLDQYSCRFLIHKICCISCRQYGLLPKNLLEAVYLIEEYFWIVDSQEWLNSFCTTGVIIFFMNRFCGNYF